VKLAPPQRNAPLGMVRSPMLLSELVRPSWAAAACRQTRPGMSLRPSGVSGSLLAQANSVSSAKSSQRIGMPHVRPLGTTRIALGLFSRSSTPASPTAPADISETPLTPFQTRIAALETAALARPDSVPAQMDLLKALLEGNEYQGVIGYYETMALGSGGAVRSEQLLRSDEAWSVYMEALAKAGRLGEVSAMVRKRDVLLAGGVDTAAAATPTPAPTAPSSLLAALPSTLAHTSTSASTPPSSSPPVPPTSALTGSTGSTGSNAGSAAGTPLSPIYVQLAPATPQANAWRAVRWVAGLILWMFVVLTVLSMVMENTGLLKAGPGPVEFEPEEGRVVKFSDVHGVEEAKAVSEVRFAKGKTHLCRV
jgi:ATP-dependent metalloprotease